MLVGICSGLIELGLVVLLGVVELKVCWCLWVVLIDFKFCGGDDSGVDVIEFFD